jgi:DNA replication protein DnaC
VNEPLKDIRDRIEKSLHQKQTEYDALPEEEKQRIRAEERRKEESQKHNELIMFYKAKGIPPKFYPASWDNWICDTEEKQEAFNVVKELAWKTNLFLSGKSGTGKTHLAMCLAKDGATYRRLPDIFREVKSDFNSEQGIIDRYGTLNFLIIDEVGRQNFSPFEKNLFFEIIDKRWNHEVPTTIITNLSESEFLKEYGTAVIDRLRPEIVEFDWESKRENLYIETTPVAAVCEDIDF